MSIKLDMTRPIGIVINPYETALPSNLSLGLRSDFFPSRKKITDINNVNARNPIKSRRR